MYRLTQSRSPRQLATEQLPTLGTALLVSEWLYKFHSFTLECLAFLATWFVLDRIFALRSPVSETRLQSISGRPDHG